MSRAKVFVLFAAVVMAAAATCAMAQEGTPEAVGDLPSADLPSNSSSASAADPSATTETAASASTQEPRANRLRQSRRARAAASKCDKCNIPVNQGGCKCNNNCDCITTPTSPNKCDKCNVPVNQGGCKCNSNCDCITTPTPTSPNKCDKCNVPVNQGGCKCNNNCDCINTQPPSGSGGVLFSRSGASATYYYGLRDTCGSGYAENDGVPSCASYTPGPYQQTLRQLNSDNVVAIDAGLLNGNRARYCGKKVNVYRNGVRISAPDGGDFFVWDGCAACSGGGGIIDFSVAGAKRLDGNACWLGVIPGVTYEVVDQQVRQFVP